MEQILKSDYIALKEAISDESQSDLSEEDDQWALVLIRVYRNKKCSNNSELSASIPEGSKES